MSEYISAEAFRQDLYFSNDAVNMGGEYKGLWVRWKAIEAAIEKHKAENIAPVIHAKWIKHFDDLFPSDSTIECSNCGEHSDLNMAWQNYCPNCGAKMDKE